MVRARSTTQSFLKLAILDFSTNSATLLPELFPKINKEGIVPDPTEERDYAHFRWTMPGGVPGGPAQPTVFSIIAAEMLLKDAPPFIEGLRGVIDEYNLGILAQAAQNLLAAPDHGPQQQHVIAFTSAETDDAVVLQAGTMVLFNILERRWSEKTISLIPVPWSLFEKIQEVATQGGFWSTPPTKRKLAAHARVHPLASFSIFLSRGRFLSRLTVMQCSEG